MRSYFFEAPEVELHYMTGGNGRFPLILLHGTTNRWQDFQPVLPYLLDNFNVFALDFRGHGLSGRVANGYRVVDFAADIVAFVQQVVQAPPLIWGHSLGGLVGISAAATLGENVRGLVIEDSPLFLRRATVQAGSPAAYAFFQAVYEAMQQSNVRLEKALATLLPPERLSGLPALAQRLPYVDPEVVRMSFDSTLRNGYDMDACLQELVCLTLVVQAEGRVLEDVDAQAVLGLLNNGRFAQVSGAGHAIHAERPFAMAQLVLNFAAELPVP